jgi:hypothetical protein
MNNESEDKPSKIICFQTFFACIKRHGMNPPSHNNTLKIDLLLLLFIIIIIIIIIMVMTNKNSDSKGAQ